MWAITALVVDIIAERMLSRGFGASGAVHVALELAPVVPLLLFIVALVRMVQHMDEMQQRIVLESVFIAFISTLTLGFVFDGVEQTGLGRPPWHTIVTCMMALWACAYVYSSWKYR